MKHQYSVFLAILLFVFLETGCRRTPQQGESLAAYDLTFTDTNRRLVITSPAVL
jgi:hypothetical protein